MSEHAWVLENLESYVAGGLDADERGELEQHVANCSPCAHALAEARAVDQKLETLFAQVRPNPALEDRSIQALRQVAQRRRTLRFSRAARVFLTAAAAVLLAGLGAGVSVLIEEEQSGSGFLLSKNLKQSGLSVDLIGGTDFKEQIREGMDKDGELLRDPERSAEEFRERSYFGIIRGQTSHGQIFSDGTTRLDFGGPTRGAETYSKFISDLTPNGTLTYKEDRNEETSVAGGTQPRQPIGGQLPGISSTNGSSSAAQSHLLGLGTGSMAGYSPPTTDYGLHSKLGVETAAKKTKGIADLTDSRKTGARYFKPGDVLAQQPESRTKDVRELDEKLKEKKDEGRSGADKGEKLGGEGKDVKQPEKRPALQKPPEAPVAPVQRKIIRSGEVEFEVDSFDAAVALVTRLVNAIRGAFVATVNSTKLSNGKMRGSIVVRVPPEHLDNLVLDLRKELGKTGELKGQRIGSQDITKQYTDLESRLRAARTMEERLLKIIRDGKGEIKDLLQAEKQLGVTRTSIEEMEGELRYYAHQVALSTLTVTLAEKEIRAAAVVSESECVQAGIEVEDVDKALRAALDAVSEAKGRVTRSELKQHAAGQFNAILHFEVDPSAAGPLRDRLRQLGNMVRLEINRVQHAESGVLTPHEGKLKRGPTEFKVSLYNLANVAPRETQTLKVAAIDVHAVYQKLREALGKVRGRVINAQLNEQDHQNVTAQLDFDVRRADEGALQSVLSEAGELLSRQVTRVPEGENVTDAKVLFKVELLPATAIPPREIITLAEEVADVDQALALMTAQVKEAHGRIVQGPQRGQERSGKVLARIVFDVPLAAAAGVVEKFKAVGQVRLNKIDPNPQAPEGRLAVARIDVTLSNELLLPQDEGLWARVRSGLSFSLRALWLSVGLLIIGVLFVLPWLLLLYAIFWLARRLWRGQAVPTPAVSAAGARGGSGTGQ